MKSIPVTIFCGFLGAGKTTMINKLLESRKTRNPFIIINEFGSVSIDGELVTEIDPDKIYQMNNGCLCCVANNDLVSVFANVMTLIESGEANIDSVLIELSGLADPGPVIQTVLNTPYMSDYFHIDSVYTLVDVRNIREQLTLYQESLPQIAYADRVLLSKFIPERFDRRIIKELHTINPFVDVQTLDLEDLQYEQYIGLNLFEGKHEDKDDFEERLGFMMQQFNDYHHHSHEKNHCHHSSINSFTITSHQSFSVKVIEEWLHHVIKLYGERILRFKGIVGVEGYDNKLIIQGVNTWFQLDKGSRWTDIPETKIVFIGNSLPEDEIKNLLQATGI